MPQDFPLPPINSVIGDDAKALPYLMDYLLRTEEKLWSIVCDLERYRDYLQRLDLTYTETYHVINAACISVRRQCRKVTEMLADLRKKGVSADRRRAEKRRPILPIRLLNGQYAGRAREGSDVGLILEKWLNE